MAAILGNVNPIFHLVFRDLTGQPLIGGTIETFKASAHTTHKATYEDRARTIPFTNPIPLNAAGVASNITGAEKPIFLSDDENYYIVVRAKPVGILPGEIIQTIDNWNADNAFSTQPQFSEIVTTNFIPNAQYSTLTNDKTLYPDADLQAHPATIAANNWQYFAQGSGATVQIEFKEFARGQTEVPFNPHYYLNFQKSVIGSLTESAVWVEIGDAATFSNQQVTFAFRAKSATLSAVEIIVDQDFAGGSADIQTVVDTFTLTSAWIQYITTFTVPDVSAKTFKAGSKFRIRVQPPLNAISNVDWTNVQLNDGDTLLEFDYQPENLNNGFASAEAIPQPLATDKNKSLTIKADGHTNEWRSNPPTGCPIAFAGIASALPDGYLLCDGALKKTSDYPQLFDVLLRFWGNDFTALHVPVTALNTYITGEPGTIVGASAATSGFTITNVNLGTDNGVNAAWQSNISGGFFVLPKVVGNMPAPTAGTTAFTIIFEDGNTLIPGRIYVTATAGAAISGGQYWTYSTPSTNYYVWYKVNGAGADPAPGGTGILVEVLSTDSAETVAFRTFAVLDKRGVIDITTIAAGSMTAGNYFLINSIYFDYAFWYSIDGVGTAPVLPGKEIVEVPIAATDTAVLVQEKTLDVMLDYTFRLPDMRNYVIKGLAPNSGIDPTWESRLAGGLGCGDSSDVGSVELDFVRSHRHPPEAPGTNFAGTPPGTQGSGGASININSLFTGFFGKAQNTVANVYMNYIIKY